MATPTGYSRTQILLHWAIGLLIVFQLIFGEDMGPAWRTVEQGGTPVMNTWIWAHIVAGILVLVLAVWRLGLRLSRGVPPAPASGSALTDLAGHVAHWAFYALMIALPVSGLFAWYGGVGSAAEVHELMKPVVIVLIVVHVGAALWHQFRLKDNLLARMKTPQA